MTSADQPPDAEDAARAPVGADEDIGRFLTELVVAQRQTPRRLSRVPALTAEAVRVVWQTDRLSTAVIVATQFALAGVAALQVILGGYAVRELLRLRNGADVAHVTVALIVLAGVTAAGSLGSNGTSQLGRLLGARVQRAITGRVLDVTTRVELVNYDDSRFYDQLSRVLANVPSRPTSVVTCLASLVGGVAGTIAITITLLIIAPVLVPILYLGALPLWLVSRRQGRMEFDFVVEQTAGFRERYYLEEMLSRRPDAAELRANGAAPYIRTRWESLYEEYLAAMRHLVRRRFLLVGVSGAIGALVAVATLIVLTVLIKHGTISAVRGRCRGRDPAAHQQVAAAGGRPVHAVRVGTVPGRLQQFPATAAGRGPARRRRRRRGVHECSADGCDLSVSERHGGRAAGVSLEIGCGEVIALVGENGSGKTTLAKLVAGLYVPDAGTVAVGGTVIDPSARAVLRNQVALVLQDFSHYAFTAAENITLGRPERPVTGDEVAEAARRVGIDSLLAGLPRGYDTRLSKMFADGRELSLGQWQRVALARAFYRDAPLVILDEPTAALDPRAEARLYEGVRSVLDGRTVVLITHRLASVRSADRIIVLHEGEIAEQGTHETLLAAEGRYAQLLAFQQNHHIRAQVAFDDSGGSE